MRKRIALLLTALMLALTMSFGAASAVFAAPITCSGNQEATKVSGGWDCINNGGNATGSERTKNPNDRK